MLVHDLLSHSAQRTPDSIAVIDHGHAVTYRALEGMAQRVASQLQRSGVRQGDRVVLALENSTALVACYFGILQSGAVVVPLPSGPRSDRLVRALLDCTPAASIVDESTWPLLASATPDGSLRRFVVSRDASSAAAFVLKDMSLQGALPPSSNPPAVVETDLAAILYTSGSTGAPRGVMLTHRNITTNTASIVDYLHLSEADRVMVVLPFYYVYGLSLLHTHVAVGGCVVLDNRFAFPNVVLNAMRDHAVTGFAGVPSTFAILLHRSNLRGTSLPALRYVTQAGGPMAPARIEEWLRAVPGVPLYVMYGATEAAARLAYVPPEELTRRPGTIGRAIRGVELRVLRDDGTVAGPGEVGELVARGPNISPGYWNCDEGTRERFGPEGYRTGDLGFGDSDGFLYLVGRRHDMIKVGAHRVSAKEIEEVVHAHPAVHEAAVVPSLHELLGEVPVAHVVLREPGLASSRDLIAFCRDRLPEHKVPAHVVFHSQLPKSGAGKIDKRALQPGGATAEVLS
jgi:acyl-CoA synthetase (AMP-forming)/AMP-acid ligase II